MDFNCSESSDGPVSCSSPALAKTIMCLNGTTTTQCNDATTMDYHDYTLSSQREPYQNAIGAAFMLIIILLSIFGNVAVILAISRTPRLREELSNILLINLSLTDLLSATMVMPYTLVALITDEWLLGPEWCTAQCALNYVCIIVSMLTLSLISVERLVAIVYPLRYSGIITHRFTYSMVTYTWLQGFAFGAVPIICKWVVYDYWEVVCAIDWDSYRDHGGLIFVIVATALCFLVPAFIMTISYVRIYRTATGHYKRRSGRQQIRKDQHQQRQEAKVILSLAFVVVMFFICTTPFCVTKCIKIFFSTDAIPVWLNFVATYMQYLASATNPFIYGIFRQDFRKAFTRLLCSSRIISFHSSSSFNSLHRRDSLFRRDSNRINNNCAGISPSNRQRNERHYTQNIKTSDC